jgi:hypothetical protein
MERGAATKDRYAKAVAGAEAIEIKATIPDHQIRSALARFRLTRNNDQERLIYFFDTPELDLLAAGIITRARRVIGDEHDSTVKFRPVDPAKVGRQWRKYRDFKIEADASEKGLVKSASFSMPVASGLIKRVAVGKRGIAELFTGEQEAFLTTMAKRTIDFKTLAVLGPISAQRWRVEDPCCPWPITAELWKREDGDLLMEVSIKAPILQAAVAVGGFMALLAEVGAERDKDEQAKTRWALDFYAAKLARESSRRGAAGKKAAGKTGAEKNGSGKTAAGAKVAGAKVASKAAVKAAGKKAAGKAAAKAAGKKAGSKNPRLTARKPAGKATAKAPRKAVRNRAAAKAPRKAPKRTSRRR